MVSCWAGRTWQARSSEPPLGSPWAPLAHLVDVFNAGVALDHLVVVIARVVGDHLNVDDVAGGGDQVGLQAVAAVE